MQSFPSYMTLSKYFNSWHLNFHISKDKENKKCLYDRDVVKTKMEKKKYIKRLAKLITLTLSGRLYYYLHYTYLQTKVQGSETIHKSVLW